MPCTFLLNNKIANVAVKMPNAAVILKTFERTLFPLTQNYILALLSLRADNQLTTDGVKFTVNGKQIELISWVFELEFFTIISPKKVSSVAHLAVSQSAVASFEENDPFIFVKIILKILLQND